MGNAAGTLGTGLAIGLVVGLGGGFLFFASGDAPDRLAGAAGGLGGTDAAASAEPLPGSAPLIASSAPPPPTPIAAPLGGFDSFGAAVAAAGRQAHTSGDVLAERGEGVVTGRVMTDDGTPLAGVLIRCVRDRQSASHPAWRSGDPAPRFDDLEERVRERVTQREQRIADTIDVSSDKAGRYRATGLVDAASYRLTAYLAGYEVRPVTSNGRSGRSQRNRGHTVRAGGSLDLLAMPITVVRVTLRLPDGTTPTKALLKVTGTQASNQPWIPRDPTLRLTPGSYKIRAEVAPEPDHAHLPTAQTYTSEESALDIGAGTPDAELSIDLRAEPGLAGTITGFGDDKSSYVRVMLLKLDPGVQGDKKALAASNQSSWAQGSNPIYRFTNLKPGRYLVGVGHQNAEIEFMQQVELADGLTVLDLALPEPKAGDTLIVHATGPDGRPVGDVSFWLSRTPNTNSVQPRRRTRTDSGGHKLDFAPQTFTPKPDTDLDSASAKPGSAPQPPPGPWVLHAHSPRLGQTTVELTRGQREVSVALRAPAKLTISLPGYAESPLKGKLTIGIAKPKDPGDDEPVSADLGWGNSRSWRGGRNGGNASVNEHGVYTSGPLEPGPREITIFVSATGQQWGGGAMPAYQQSITLIAGDNNLTLRLPVTHPLHVKLDKSDGRAWLQIQAVTEGGGEQVWWGNGTQADDAGTVTFNNLPPGRYKLFRNTNGAMEQMHVTVPAQHHIEFVPEANNAFVVWIQAADGLLAAAGLEQGDHVVALDGKPFTDSRAFVAALRAAGEEITLGYTRKGKHGTAKLNRDALTAGMMTQQGLGGSLTPTSAGR